MKKNLLLATTFALMSLAEAKLVTKPVIYEQGGAKLEGYLAYDDAKTTPGKTPGILVVPEWWGLNAYAKSRAEQLAAMGYVAFAADMYGQGKVTEDAAQAKEWAGPFYGKPAMAERAAAALDQLKKVDLVDPAKLAAIGFCFGGSTVQALAYRGAPLLGIVSFHGGPVPAPESVAGKVKTKFLLLNGALDPMVKAEDRVALEKSLETAKIDYQSIDYAGAVHAFSNPDADRLAAKNGLTGMIGYNANAATRGWQQMSLFFAGLFGSRD